MSGVLAKRYYLIKFYSLLFCGKKEMVTEVQEFKFYPKPTIIILPRYSYSVNHLVNEISTFFIVILQVISVSSFTALLMQ